MNKMRKLTYQFSFRNDKLLGFIVIGSLLALSADAPLWAIIISLAALIWRFFAEINLTQIPSRILTGVAGVGIFILTFLEHKTLLGRDASVTLLVALTGLKVLECSNQRDRLFLFLFSLGLIGFKFLYQLDLWIVFPAFLFTLAVFYLMLGQNKMIPKEKLILKHVAISIPIMILLFLVFPRQQFRFGAGFGLGNDESIAQSGFTEDLVPGSISELVKIRETAFRAQFKNTFSLNRDLYWRGSVLTKSEGLSWKRDFTLSSRDIESKIDEAEQKRDAKSADYEVLLEPHGKNWIFSLEPTESISSTDLQITKNKQSGYVSTSPIFRNINYKGFLRRDGWLKPTNEKDFLQTPKLSLQVQKLLEPAKLLPNRKAQIEFLESLFKKDFVYTLKPGRVQSLDDFLFVTKKGFCEHFAGAFATLAREIGIPARVVVGYQGGTYNRIGDFWKVLQSDAHAWIEYVDDNQVWKSLDPTFIVAPSRIEIGSSAFTEESFVESLGFTARKFDVLAYFEDILIFFESLNYRWNIFLIEFDQNRQKEFLKELLMEIADLTLITGLLGILLIYFAFAIYLKNRSKSKKLAFEQKAFLELEIWARKNGLIRPPNQSPLAFLVILSEKFPKMKKIALDLARIYEEAIYENNPDPSKQKQWKKDFSKK